jgi:hypothetical protein
VIRGTESRETQVGSGTGNSEVILPTIQFHLPDDLPSRDSYCLLEEQVTVVVSRHRCSNTCGEDLGCNNH